MYNHCLGFTERQNCDMKASMAVLGMPGHLIRRLHQHSTLCFAQRTQEAGLEVTPVQFAALDAIQAHPGLDQAQVAERIGYDRATIGGVIDRLEKKGWVVRVVSTQDRRSRQLSLSSQGQDIYRQLETVVQAVQNDILHPLNAAEQKKFMALARRVLAIEPDKPS